MDTPSTHLQQLALVNGQCLKDLNRLKPSLSLVVEAVATVGITPVLVVELVVKQRLAR
jgi:hypothetical protein